MKVILDDTIDISEIASIEEKITPKGIIKPSGISMVWFDFLEVCKVLDEKKISHLGFYPMYEEDYLILLPLDNANRKLLTFK